jgi:hypothetical protein
VFMAEAIRRLNAGKLSDAEFLALAKSGRETG